MTDIRELMELWVRWRCSGHRRQLGYGPTMIGRMLDGMPSTKCTICNGAGKVAGHRVGAWADHVTCPNCAGKGKIKALSTMYKINPVCIQSTHRESDDPVSERIDQLVAGLSQEGKTLKYWFILYYEYLRSGTQEMKAAKMGWSQQYYSRLLQEAYVIICEGLGLKKRLGGINIHI